MELGGAGELHAACLTESRTREPGLCSVQEIRVAPACMGRKRWGAAHSNAPAMRGKRLLPEVRTLARGLKVLERTFSAQVRLGEPGAPVRSGCRSNPVMTRPPKGRLKMASEFSRVELWIETKVPGLSSWATYDTASGGACLHGCGFAVINLEQGKNPHHLEGLRRKR